jgi:hypothetical protein
MKEPLPSADEAKLSQLLHTARPAPELPPRFQENVWRRIERAPELGQNRGQWLDRLAAWILRPQLALAAAALLVVAGAGLGWARGAQQARSEAQARYVAAVAPNAFH